MPVRGSGLAAKQTAIEPESPARTPRRSEGVPLLQSLSRSPWSPGATAGLVGEVVAPPVPSRDPRQAFPVGPDAGQPRPHKAGHSLAPGSQGSQPQALHLANAAGSGDRARPSARAAARAKKPVDPQGPAQGAWGAAREPCLPLREAGEKAGVRSPLVRTRGSAGGGRGLALLAPAGPEK